MQANFAQESKADADAMVENLRSAFKELVPYHHYDDDHHHHYHYDDHDDDFDDDNDDDADDKYNDENLCSLPSKKWSDHDKPKENHDFHDHHDA